MPQERIEAEILRAGLDRLAGSQDSAFAGISALMGQGYLAEAYAMVPIDGMSLRPLLTRRIVVLTIDVPTDKTQEIANKVGRIPGLKVTRTDLVDDIDSWPPDLRD